MEVCLAIACGFGFKEHSTIHRASQKNLRSHGSSKENQTGDNLDRAGFRVPPEAFSTLYFGRPLGTGHVAIFPKDLHKSLYYPRIEIWMCDLYQKVYEQRG